VKLSELFQLDKSFSHTADLEELRGEQPYKLKSRAEMKIHRAVDVNRRPKM